VKLVVPLVAAMAIALTAPGARADFAAGAQAYDGGDYRAAFAEWIVLARGGNASAQIAIAGMFRFGEGRPVDAVESAKWYRRAAETGAPIAQLNLGEMYMLGLGVPRDAVRAHLWLSLAARQGRRWARDRRDALERGMSDAEIGRARGMRRDWKGPE
jgi:TPR repeat protein